MQGSVSSTVSGIYWGSWNISPVEKEQLLQHKISLNRVIQLLPQPNEVMKSDNEPCYGIISWKPTGHPGLLLPLHSMVINIDRNHHTFQIELQYALLPKALEKEHHIYCPERTTHLHIRARNSLYTKGNNAAGSHEILWYIFHSPEIADIIV